jgi:gliding motility-associated-like protein
MNKIIFSLLVLFSLFFAKEVQACHAIALVNVSLTTSATAATFNASSDSPTCGCDSYWMDVEVRCIGEAFDAAPFNPGFWGPLNTYPYFQSAQMEKPSCVVQAYPSVTIPFAGLCPGVTYQVRGRENHNGLVGPWSATRTFTAPGTLAPLVCEVQASNTTICAGECVSLDAVITGGCGLAASYQWTGVTSTNPSVNVCPTVTTTYTVTITEDCSGQTTTCSATVTVLPLPVAGTAAISAIEVCQGEAVNLTLTGSAGNIQWQSATSGAGPWTNIGGATGSTYTSPALSANTCYRAEVSGCGTPVVSNVVCVTVIPTVTPTFTALGPYCQCSTPGVLPTTSTNGIVGTWSPATISTTASGTTTYTFTPNAGQCALQTTMDVTISPIAVTMPANAGTTVACPSGTNTAPTAPTVQDNCSRTLAVSAPVVSALPACSGTRTYTYTYTDACGVTYPWVYTYTISAPVVAMPAGEGSTVACATNATAPTPPTVVDNCSRTLTVSAPVVTPDPACAGTKTYTYTYTDCAGATYPWVYTYTISAPIVAMPAGQSSTVACATNATAPAAPTVVDNCNRTLAVSAPVVTPDPACAGTKTYTYTYTDCAGTTYPWVYTYTISAPIVAMPADDGSTVACAADATAPVTPNVLDNCNRTLAVSAPVVTPDPACAGTKTYTYTYTDCSGATYPWVYTYTISAPVVVMPAGQGSTVACAADATPPTEPTVTDNCNRTLAVSAPVVTPDPACAGTKTYTYTYTDCAGATYPWVYTYTISAPVVVMPAGEGSTIACATDATTPTPPTVVDNCNRTLTVSAPVVTPDPACAGTKTYTYTYTDCAGATYPWVYTYTISAPVVVMPAGEGSTVSCTTDMIEPVAPVVEDNCGRTLVVSAPVESPEPACGATKTFTYTYTDCAGATYTWVYTYTFIDNIDPTASNPADIVVPGGPVPAPDITVVTDEADNCTLNPVVAWVSDSSDGAACPETITRIYSVTDDCGNQITVTQLILITDPFPPTASNPAPVAVQCIGDVPAPDITVVTDAADNNGDPIVTWEDDTSDGFTCPQVITRRYRVTDLCGNFIFVEQTITINDDIAPAGTAPVAVAVQCLTDVPAPNTALVTGVSDNCTVTPLVEHLSDVSNGQTCPEVITRTYRITDDCGNFTDVTQTITINDDTAPLGTAPAAVTVECIGDVPVADIALVTGVSDNCTAAPVVAFVSDASDGNTCAEVITRTYSITDACGNVTLVTQTITIDDTTDPTASNPADITVPGGPVPAPDITVVTDEADNCTLNPVVAWVSDSSDGAACPETITRIYSVTDDCGNQITVTQLILITDPFPPTASNPAPVAVQCIGDVPAPDITVVTDAADNNGDPIVTWEDDTSDGFTCPQVITRRYRVTDLCGNFIFVEQTITINDDIAPAGTAPVAVAVQCIGDVPAPDVTLVTGVSDNCTVTPLVEHLSDVSNGQTCPEVITRTYRITDDCGNFTDVSHIITINDDIAPVGTAPAAVTVECIGDVPVADIAGVTGVSDNCTVAPVVAFVSDLTDGNTCAEVITRTYSITDECGNVTFVTQTITIDDTTDPTASNPADITVPGGPVPAPDITVVTDEADNCTLNPVVEWVSDVSDNGACPEIITRTYSVTDDCGNQITVTQLIFITDPFPPTASNPAPVAVQCIGDVPAPNPAIITDAADNNGDPIVTWEDDTSNGQTCPQVITRRYRVTDDCGNFIFVQQIITVNDDINPVGNAPANITVVCPTDVPAPNTALVTGVSDNCTVNPLVQHVSDVSDNNVCNGEIITRTYSITDDCGNSITVTQLITISAVTPSFTITSSSPTTCSGTDGFITFTGLNPNESYMFSYNGNAVTTITTNANGQYVLGGLPAGTYTSFQFYSPPCPLCSFTSNTVINLVDPNAPPIDAGQNQTVCEGTPVTLTATNPSGATISWNNGVTNGVAFNSPIGTVQYVVTANLNNCISTDAVSITVNPIPNVDAGPDQVICEGEFVTLNGSGANSYVWDNGVTNGQTFSPAQTTTYTVVGTSIGCSASDQMTVTVNVQPQVSFTASDLEGCIPVTVDFSNTTTNVNSAQCSWSMGNLAVLSGCEQTFTFTQAGCYNITLQITSDEGCVGSATYQNFICVDDYPVANFSISPLFLTPINNQATFNNGSIGAETYEWNFGDGNTSNAVDPLHTYYSDGEDSYMIQLIAYSELGCPDTTYGRIDMREDLIFYVPNTFTPDGDDYNETFLPIFTTGFDPYDFNLLIFNRWGEILFESNNHQVGWDGTYGGKVVKDGTYIWKIEFKTKYTDERKVHHGHVNLLR